MKKYAKPTVEVKTFTAVNKIADVTAWLNTSTGEGKVVGAAGVTTDAISSYVLAS